MKRASAASRWLSYVSGYFRLRRPVFLVAAVMLTLAVLTAIVASPLKGVMLRAACELAPGDEMAAFARGISLSTVEALHRARGLSGAEICQLTDAKLHRAISKALHPRPDHPGEAVAFRNFQQQDENGQIPADGIVRASKHLKTMRVLGKPSTATYSTRVAGISQAGWVPIGPQKIGGRIRAIAVNPANGDQLWIGSISGGIWSSVDGGMNWTVVDDFMANLAVSTIVIDPQTPINLTPGSETGTLYAGTGEGFYNGHGIRGAGIFKSTNAGKTWSQLTSTSNSNFYYVNRLAISADGSRLLAATRTGLWVSSDAGATWNPIITPGSPNLTDVDFAPGSNTEAVASGYFNGEVFKLSYNIGTSTWSVALATGIPSTAGRVEVAYAPSNANIVYASVEINNGEIWKSTNGGANFTKTHVSAFTYLGNQGWYDNALWVDPTNPNTLIVGGIDLWRSTDGGTTLTKISSWGYGGPPNYYSAHADHHAIVAHPGFNGTTNKMVYFGNDGGIYRTADVYTVNPNNSETSGWVVMNNNLAITQFYDASGHAGTTTIVGGTQDNGTLRYTPAGGAAGWEMISGGDGGYSASDPTDSTTHYGEYIYLKVHRITGVGATYSEDIAGVFKSPPYTITDAQNNTANFIAPIALDANAPNRLLAGGESLWRTEDAKTPNTSTTGPSWYSIKAPTGAAGSSGYISAIAVSKGNSDVVWVGHNNGDVYFTTNGTAASPAWTRVDLNSPGLPNRVVLRIAIDHNDTNTVYVSFGGYSTGNLWRTRNGGASWDNIHGVLPAAPVRALALHPNDSRWLYVGTEIGLFAAEDARDAASPAWGLPGSDSPANVSVDQLFFLGTKLVAATYGRGLFMHVGGDTTAPSITITAPTSSTTYTSSSATLTTLAGTASDNVGVTQVSWSNNLGGSGTASGTTSWSVGSIALQSGTNVITVTARDAANNTNIDTISVSYSSGGGGSTQLQNGVPVTGLAGASGTELRYTIDVPAGASNLVFQLSGGTGDADLYVRYATAPTISTYDCRPYVPGNNETCAIPATAGTWHVLVYGYGAFSGASLLASYTVGGDTTAPSITITAPTSSTTYTSSSATLTTLAGTASDNVGVTQVSWSNNLGGSGTASGTTSWSVGSIALQNGTNVITVTARDAANNTSTDTISVSYSSGGGGSSTGSSGGGGCFIATAAYGTPMADEVRHLRAFRDQYLLSSKMGRYFVEFYYRHSPVMADTIRQAPAIKALVRLVLGPFVALSRLLVSDESLQAQTSDRP